MKYKDLNMHYVRTVALLMLSMSVLGNIDVRRGGWLHRVVQYHKGKFIKELRKLAPIQIKAKIIPAPKGYKDSDKWNLESVLHLIVLIRTSQSAAPVYRALRRSLMPSRRIMMSMADSFKHFPSLSNFSLNEIYYDFDTMEEYDDPKPVFNGPSGDDGIIVVSNPVEARLPSTQISIKLIKDILVSRAIAGRAMPSTTRAPIPWTPMNVTTTTAASGETKDDGDKEDQGDVTESGAATAAITNDANAPSGEESGTTPVNDAGGENAGDGTTTTIPPPAPPED